MNPPAGIAWKETLQEGKTEAGQKKLPIIMFVADDNANSSTLASAFQAPKVVQISRYFVCVFVCKTYKLQNFQQSYVPWIAVTAQTTFSPPVLIFGDSSGNAHQEFRVEGKALGGKELFAQMEKVLKKLAPNAARGISGSGLKSLTLTEFCEKMETSLTTLENNLSAERLALFREEAKLALETMKHFKSKLRKIKDKEAKEKAEKNAKELEKSLKSVGRYRGGDKEAEKTREHFMKARESLAGLKAAVENIRIETEVLTCRVQPRNKKPVSFEELKAGLEELDYVMGVEITPTDETVKIQGEEFKVAVCAITCEKGASSKSEIERTIRKHGYQPDWTK